MSTTLYFSKININSHIFDVYEDKDKLKAILKLLYLNIKEDVNFVQENLRLKENGETYLYSATYKFNLIEKFDDYTIAGSIIKTSNLFINEVDEKTGEIKKIPVENSEVIEFYFDVYKEIVAFYTTNRFGYNGFNTAFKELLNRCMSMNEEYNFEVSLLREGLSVEEIQNQLKNIGNLEMLKIEIIPPNPDDDLLDEIQQNGEKFLTDIKNGNVTQKSTIFTSKAPRGLNIDAKIIQEELQGLDKIHSKLSSEEATKKGYVTVEAINKNGRLYSTNENEPIKYKLDEKPKSLVEFKKEFKERIVSVVSSLL